MIDIVQDVKATIAACRPVSWSQANALMAEIARLNALNEVLDKAYDDLEQDLINAQQANFDRT